jgi:DNA-binding transcriptional MerR regulator
MVPPKFYKIGEVMRYSGLSRQTIHNYTVMGLIAEAERTPSNHRLYDGQVFERLARIRELRERMTLQEVKRALDHDGRPRAEASA